MPGPANSLMENFSISFQLPSLFGLVLLPVSLIWLFYNMSASENWKVPYILGIISLALMTFLLILVLAFNYSTGALNLDVLLLPLACAGIYQFWKLTRSIKTNRSNIPAVPYFISSIVIVSWLLVHFVVPSIATWSRNQSIKNLQPLVQAIGKYHKANGSYPDKLELLVPDFSEKINTTGILGNYPIQYVKKGDRYQLRFKQWHDRGIAEEIVLFDSDNQHDIKDAYASYDTPVKGWRYYWLD